MHAVHGVDVTVVPVRGERVNRVPVNPILICDGLAAGAVGVGMGDGYWWRHHYDSHRPVWSISAGQDGRQGAEEPTLGLNHWLSEGER